MIISLKISHLGENFIEMLHFLPSYIFNYMHKIWIRLSMNLLMNLLNICRKKEVDNIAQNLHRQSILWSELRTPIERIFQKHYAKLTQTSLIWVSSYSTLLIGNFKKWISETSAQIRANLNFSSEVEAVSFLLVSKFKIKVFIIIIF